MNTNKFSVRWRLIPVLLSGIFLISACGDKETKNGQALIRVNGDEITVPQLNEELAQDTTQQAAAGQDQIAQRKKTLETLVDRQLLTGKATQDGLNRDLDILLSLERAKAQILAQAYIKKHIESAQPPSETEISAFYKAHPDYFEQRKIFELKEVAIDSNDYNEKTQEATNAAKSIDEITSWLEIHRIKNTVTQSVRTSSDLPEQVAKKASHADSPQIFVLNASGKTMFIALNPIKDSPISLQDASSGISEYLINKKNEDAAEALVHRLRSEAKIDYLNLKAVGLDSKTVLFSDDAAKPASGDGNGVGKSDGDAAK